MEEELRWLLRMLEERLVRHDDNRKELQDELEKICSNVLKEADTLEEGLAGEIRGRFARTEESILSLIERLTRGEKGGGSGTGDAGALIKRAQEELSTEQEYEVSYSAWTENFADSCKFSISTVVPEEESDFSGVADRLEYANKLKAHLDRIKTSMMAAQHKLIDVCAQRRGEADKLRRRINGKMEPFFAEEDARLQEAMNTIRGKSVGASPNEVKELSMEARAALVPVQKYALGTTHKGHSLDNYDLVVKKESSLECFRFEERKPSYFIPLLTDKGEVPLSFAFFSDEEKAFLKPFDLSLSVVLSLWEEGHSEDTARTITKEYDIEDTNEISINDIFATSTTYCMKMKIVHQDSCSEWSDVSEFTTSEFKACCMWKECPDNVDVGGKYLIDEENTGIATKVGDGYSCTIIGNTSLPLGKVCSWYVKLLRSKFNNGWTTYVGVAPSDIDQNEDYNSNHHGWYVECCESKLYSGPPHNYKGREYGPKKKDGEYVHTGDAVGVVIDTANGDLSFVVNRVNFGVAYEEVPLDKPLVPCVILGLRGDSVEIDTSEVKENVDSTVSVPSNIRTVDGTTWDTFSLTWDSVEGALLYQIEMDGSKFWDASMTNAITKVGFPAGTEHSFRVRAVRRDSVGEWSDVVIGRTPEISFAKSFWVSCPDDVGEKRKYSVVEGSPRVAIKKGYNNEHCTVAGNVPIPLDAITSWNVKVLDSKENNGQFIFVGVTQSDVDQDVGDNYRKCGWYFNCYESTLCSGPPHNYRGKAYGLRKDWNGQYVQPGDNIGVVMDTIKGELSFVLNNINHGVAFEEIPLDKPLVPCVLLKYNGESVELDLSEVKGNELDSSIPVPPNVTAKNGVSWDSIVLTWDAVEGASLYQIEVNGSKLWRASTKNTYTEIGLLSETEYCFRVRTVRESSVSEWSDAAKRSTRREYFEISGWKECPEGVDGERKYAIYKKNPRSALKVGNECCTIIGNTCIPTNTVTAWSVKVLNSSDSDGKDIFVGVAPSSIDQNAKRNYDNCGWYLNCWASTLRSGPPHEYNGRVYGPRKEKGQYVRTKDTVGVVMDTTKGVLSFVLNNVDHGAAYEEIPLDEPLVPCVILGHIDDHIELCAPEVKETADSSVPVPSNITAKGEACDAITLTWDKTCEDSFYQVEVDGSKSPIVATSNTFTNEGLLPNTEHTFRVRAMGKDRVSEWSDAVKGRSLKVPEFPDSVWKECPDYVWDKRKYAVDEGNPRIATKIGLDEWCTITGSMPIPPSKVSMWNIKVLKSKRDDIYSVYVGVAPVDIDQNETVNCFKCGWYFDCYGSTLCSGPPHNYRDREYGPRKEDGTYVCVGDPVGVMMDTGKGELSFVVGGVWLGVAFGGVPLDEPIVPCVVLSFKDDSVEFIPVSEDSSNPGQSDKDQSCVIS